jgi:outer membrane protein, heavy metal efflux system
MSSREKLVLSHEVWEGDCEEKKSPFEGGRGSSEPRGMMCEGSAFKSECQFKSTLREEAPHLRGDRKRSFQGCVDGALSEASSRKRHRAPAEHTPRLEKQATPFFLCFSPLKRGFSWAIALCLVLFICLINQPIQAQGVDASHNTPPPDKNILSGYSPRGETLYPQLEEYIQIAIEENPELRSLHHLYEAEKERAREVGVLPDPELTVMYDFKPMMYDSQLGRFSVSAMQMFPWFGTLGTKRDAQRASAGANRAQIDVRQLEILRDLQLAWFDIAEVEQQIRVTEEQIDLVQELERLVEIRYETGRAAQADILRIQMEEARLKNRIENLEDQLKPLKANFNEYLNRTPDTDVETAEQVETQQVLYSDQQIHQMVLAENPRFDGIESRGDALDKQQRIAQLDGRPSFGLGLEVMGRDFGPMSMFPDARESFVGMATVRLPIFRSRTNSQQQQIASRKRALDSERIQTENRLSSEVESALEALRKAERNLRLLDEELIPRATQALDILGEEYTVGRSMFDELLQIQRELLDLEIERIEAVVEHNKAVVRIESLIGNSPLSRGDR